jgi:chromosome segregation ATPase
MGKKTNNWIKQLNKLAGECDEHLQRIYAIAERMGEVKKELVDLEHAHNKRTHEIDPMASTQHEKEIMNDPEIKRIEKELDTIGKDFGSLMGDKSRAQEQLKGKAIEFKGILTEFSTYITKKEKSKNPFRGKKSVPAAKQYIAQGEDFLDVLRSAMR